MKACIIHEFGNTDVIKYEDIPTPVPGPGDVLVRVRAVSVNRGFDVDARAGNSVHGATLPLIMGVDPSGEITAVGPGVEPGRVGEHVNIRGMARCGKCNNCLLKRKCSESRPIGITAPGGYAEYIVVPDFQAREIPKDIPFADATVICRHASAAYSEVYTSELKEGEWALVMGAAGALASFVIQMAKLKGAKVIAAAGGEDRLETARGLGADYTINYRSQNLTEEIIKITEDYGVDVVFENIGDPELWTPAFNSLAMNGRLVTVGYHGGGIVPIDIKRLHMKRLRVLSSVMDAGAKDVLSECLQMASEGKIRSLIGKILPLSKAAEGHRLVENNEVIGKVILEP
ncbi:MAG: NADPH:quinone reductase-like Zn-dependent oxidoreductase [Alcanivorax sp.]|jgi:NADPH:quinone reductase-like Zn-dependent oxidoreductase